MAFPYAAAAALVAGGLNFYGQERANSQNRHSAQAQMNFQKEMSSTSYQRSVKDLQDAGLNPMLAYMNGGASTPSGASSTSNSSAERSVSSAMEARRLYADLQNLREMNDKIKSDVALNKITSKSIEADIVNKALSTASQVRLQNAQGDLADSQIALNAFSAKQIAATVRKILAELPGKELKADVINALVNAPNTLKARAESEYKRYHPNK